MNAPLASAAKKCTCFCGSCSRQDHKNCSNVTPCGGSSTCGCICGACRNDDHKNCSHVNACAQKGGAPAPAPAGQVLGRIAVKRVAVRASKGDPDCKTCAGAGQVTLPPLPGESSAAMALACPACRPGGVVTVAAAVEEPEPESVEAVAVVEAPLEGGLPEPVPLSEAPTLSPPEARAEEGALLASRAAPPSALEHVIGQDITRLTAALMHFEEEVGARPATAERGKVLVELSECLELCKRMSRGASELALRVERLKLAETMLDHAEGAS